MSIYVVSHKDYDVRKFENLRDYRLVFVGAEADSLATKYGAQTDAGGDSISQLNSSFCELTVLYWIWKNSTDEVNGLVHYRRFFCDGEGNPLSLERIPELKDNVFVVPEKYWLLQTVEKHYSTHHSADDLVILRKCLKKLHPEYLASFDEVMNRKYLYPYNMLIANRAAVDSYCKWLFPILFEFCEMDKQSRKDAYQRRVVGFLAERLFSVYLLGGDINVIETSVRLMEGSIKRSISMGLASFINRSHC